MATKTVREMAREEEEATPQGDETAPDDADADEEEAEAESQAPADQRAEAEASTLREAEEAGRKLDRENTAHGKRVQRILGEQFDLMRECPRCLTTGYVFTPDVAPVPEEQAAEVIASLGSAGGPQFKQLAGAATCGDCDGYGRVLTGSKAPEHETTTCMTCSGRGWNQTMATTSNPPLPTATGTGTSPNGVSTAPTVPQRPEPYFNPATQRWELP